MNDKKAKSPGGKDVKASRTTSFYLVKNQDSHPAANKSYVVSRGQLDCRDGRSIESVVDEVREWYIEYTGVTLEEAKLAVPDNGELTILMTRRGLSEMIYRASKNPEDVPQPSFFTDILEELI